MLHTDAKSLKKSGDKLFSDKRPLDRLNQEIAENFFPERAAFTQSLELGENYAEGLMSSYPLLVRRKLSDAIGSMLRPRSQQWFHMASPAEDRAPDYEADAWMEWATGVMFRAMYDRVARFTTATKAADGDFAAFGQPCMSVELNRRGMALLFRTWHPGNVAWRMNAFDDRAETHRAWRPTVQELFHYLPKGSFHSSLHRARQTEPDRPVTVRHVIVDSEEYGSDEKKRHPFRSLLIDVENNHLIEDVPSWSPHYIIPIWARLTESQYGYSPAAMCALPDARLLQSMTYTILQAGEKAVNPPVIVQGDVIRGDVDLRAGGITALDAEYDEKMGEALRPVPVDKSGIPFGLDIADRTSELLKEAFYLNAIQLPPHGGPDMTAFEVGQRVQEYIRGALPLFEPIEHEYNGAICEAVFEILMRNGGFGSPDQIPEGVGESIKFKFESPLAEAIERQKGQKFLESKAMVAEAVALDEGAALAIDANAALRDVLDGIGTPAKWMRSPEDVDQMRQKRNQQMEMEQTLAAMSQGADVAQKLGVQADQFVEQVA